MPMSTGWVSWRAELGRQPGFNIAAASELPSIVTAT
jgi:hypothetical protein